MSDEWGGARLGAGRPKGSKSQSTLMKEKALEDAHGDARRAFAKIIEWGDDEALDISFRFMCYREVLDRVWGRAPQAVRLEGNLDIATTVRVYLPNNGRENNQTPSGATGDFSE